MAYTWGGRPVAPSLGQRAQLPQAPKPPKAAGTNIRNPLTLTGTGGPSVPYTWGQRQPYGFPTQAATSRPPIATTPPAPGLNPAYATTINQQVAAQNPQPPLDSIAQNAIATHLFDVNNQINSLGRTDAQSLTALNDAIAQLGLTPGVPNQTGQLQHAQLAAMLAEHRRGADYSTVAADEQGNITDQYLARGGGLSRNYADAHSNYLDQVGALQSGTRFYNRGQALASVQRAADAAKNNPALGAPAPKTKTTKLTPVPGRTTLTTGPSGTKQARAKDTGRTAKVPKVLKSKGGTSKGPKFVWGQRVTPRF